jgi:WG containing repeat
MLHVFLPLPFADAARQALFDSLHAALRAGLPADAPALLAGNLALPGQQHTDAVLVRPHSLTLLLLQPGPGGELRIPDFTAQSWLLDGQPVPAAAPALNPYQAFRQLLPAALELLTPLLPPEAVNPLFVTGLWVPGGALRFGTDVEASMAAAPEARQLQLLPEVSRLPRRVAQLATPEIELTAADIRQLAEALPAAVARYAPAPAAEAPEEAASLGTVVQNTARQLWRWLGAEDVDELPPDTYELAARGEDRKHELEEQQAALQQQLTAQMQAIEAREAAREQSMAQLRAELARAQQQAAPNTAELQARLAAESRAKASEEASRHASEQEWQRRNQDLDTKIQALEQLIQRLQAPTADSTTPPTPAPVSAASPTSTPAATVPRPATVAAPSVVPPTTGPTPAAPRPADYAHSAPAGPQPTPKPAAQVLQDWKPRLTAALQRGRQLLPATDHWLWLATGGLLGLVAMIWLGTQVFKPRPPEPYQSNGLWGFARRGEPVIEARYRSVQPFQQERAVVELDGAFGFVDADGQEVVPPAYDALNSYADGYARARIGELYTFLDAEGQEFSHYFYNAYDFAEGYAPVLDRRGWFYISGPDTGIPDRPRLFQEAYPFRDGLARVRKNDAYSFITPAYLADTTRTDFAPFGRYEQASDFENGRAKVRLNGRSFFINEQGETVEE